MGAKPESGAPCGLLTAMETKETLVRIVLLALLLYASICLASAGRELHAARALAAELRAEIETVERGNAELGRKLDQGWSAEDVEALARERLGLVLPGDRIFRFETDPPEGQAPPAG